MEGWKYNIGNGNVAPDYTDVWLLIYDVKN